MIHCFRLAQYYYIFFSFVFFFERKSSREKERQKLHPLIHSQMAIAVELDGFRSQEPHPGLPHGLQGPGTSTILYCFPRRLASSRDLKQCPCWRCSWKLMLQSQARAKFFKAIHVPACSSALFLSVTEEFSIYQKLCWRDFQYLESGLLRD